MESWLREAPVPLSASDEIPSKIYCIQVWAVSQQKGIDKSGRIQGQTLRCTVGLERLIGEERKKRKMQHR